MDAPDNPSIMNRKRTLLVVIFASLGFLRNGLEGAEPTPLSWDNWQPLIGNWKAKGGGTPGEGAGGFSFAFDLQNKIVVRKSHTDYPAAQRRPAFAHDDLLVVYAD